ncbi:hypothetical protein DFJ58DRAFT_848124 [Suillus subalutaceus]|uniref:uncharacterized protein n=1 Tax=Suillus subalutaceus TaxID=48586 RepID=UPI001B85E8DE|nr:uncharacterized protein DFJ58DRAFT_848124 [Suillus subalutaceus]KAG1831926.1 hypothetical protein DFJ58DRAFT_848124 [Suillus subalutaceus]
MAIQEPSLMFSYETHDSLLGQDPLACKDSDNGHVAQLKQQLTELQHAVASLQADKLRLIKENTGLNMTCQTLHGQNCPHWNLIENLIERTTHLSNHGQRRNGRTSVPRRHQQCLELPEAHLEDLGAWCKASMLHAHTYRMSKVYLSRLNAPRQSWNLMLSSFQELDTQGLAPDSIGQASLQVLHWLIHTLRKHCFEFHLCADNWKVMKLMTNNYSQWFNYHVKKRTGKHIKAEHGESSPDLSEDALPSVQKCGGNSDQDLEADHPKKRARTDQPVIEPITKNNEVIPDMPQHPLPERELTPPPCADKGKDKELTTIEIKNPLSNVVLKPRPKPVNRISPSISINSPTASTSGTSPILAPPSTPSCTDGASLAVKAKLINQSSTTIEMKARPNTIKKRQPSTKPMPVSSKITAQYTSAKRLYSSTQLALLKGAAPVMMRTRMGWREGGKAGRREGGKAGRREGGKAGRRDGGKGEGRDGGKVGRAGWREGRDGGRVWAQ